MRWLIGAFVSVNLVVLIVQLVAFSGSGPEPVTASVIPADVASAPQLKLLRELEPATLAAMRRRSPDRSEEPELSVLCTLVGPFSKLLRAEFFVERLAALELQASIEELEIPGEAGYWVYLPSQGSRRQAFNILRELQAKGIDSYVIPKGELENGISFGMFSRKDLADQRLKAMRAEGYDVELEEVTRSMKETWVVLPPGQANQLSQETWQEMLFDEKDELERRQNYCPPVASQ